MDELMIVANVAIIFGVMYKLFELYAKRKERIMLIEKLPPELLDKVLLRVSSLPCAWAACSWASDWV